MQPFRLVEPTSVAEVVSAVKEGGPEARIIAGGTALMIMVKQRLFAPTHLISVQRVPELAGIRWQEGEGLWLGATARHEEIHQDAAVRRHIPLLSAAAGRTANIRIRNVGTIGGNLAHADYQSDPPTALLALEAEVHLRGPAGLRVVPLSDFFLGPYATVMREHEVLVGVHVPQPPAGAKMAYLKFSPGSAGDRPILNVAAMLQADGDECREIRLSVGAVSGRPERLTQVESMLRGRTLTVGLIAQAAEAAREAVDPLDDMRGSTWYKRQMTGVFVKRALLQVMGLETGEPIARVR